VNYTMSNLPVTHNAPQSVKSAFRETGKAKSASDRLRAALAAPNLLSSSPTAQSSARDHNLMLRFPDFGIEVEQLEQFLG
jgi:hypothetical protein